MGMEERIMCMPPSRKNLAGNTMRCYRKPSLNLHAHIISLQCTIDEDGLGMMSWWGQGEEEQ